MYALAVKHLYPDYLKRESEFVFLKFDLSEDLFGNPGSGIIRMGDMTDEELEGFEYYLTEVQEFIDNFSEKDGVVGPCVGTLVRNANFHFRPETEIRDLEITEQLDNEGFVAETQQALRRENIISNRFR